MTALAALLVSALVPIAPATVEVRPCPAYLPTRASCYVAATQTIYWADRNPHTLYHEYGHAYDDQRLDDRDRARLRPLLGAGRSAPWPEEVFADFFASCALGQDRWRDLPLRGLRRVCRFIRARPLLWRPSG